ncbi:hypothetical protein [Bacillus subtilis]|uniref:hypothetical protein n=1 Tax=Bacillus subtilis TaxID=1423 RepID=UPI002417A3B7|nr:hypothetical protein [Bacillus subtilis]WFO97841.1 hypothetical protein JEQ25_12480 [Bacillus subtilis]
MRQIDVQYSVIQHLAKKTGFETVWSYDGVVLPETKPFITVQQRQNTPTVVSKQRESVRMVYRFQIGLHTNTATERATVQEQLNRIFLFDKIALINANEPSQTLGLFYVNLTAEVPLPAEEVADKTQYHRVYFDIEIDTTLNA